MYDRDYVKALEQEIEISGGNHFEGWRLSSEKGNAMQSDRSEQIAGPTRERAHE